MAQNLVEFFKHDPDLKLVCTGYCFTIDELNFFKQLGIDKNIIQINISEDEQLSWLYKNAICFIFPSLYEGFGFPILEAFSSGCPVVCSNGGSLKEIGGKAVAFFDPKDSIDFKTKLSEVLYNKNVRDNMILNGFNEYKKYSWEKCRTETINVYKSII
jgi:glycosyltransferase involved in cell wall biosynthesis